MDKTPHFIFDRTLSPKELNFWSTFFDYFPCHHNRYFQSAINSFSKEFYGVNSEIEQYYEKIKLFQTEEELISFVSNSKLPNPARDNYEKIIKDFNKIVPNAKPVELFLMSIYSGYLQDWNLSISSNGINLEPGDKPIEILTYVPQLAMIADLMSGRISKIFGCLNFEPIKISGETILIDEKNNKKLLFSIEENNLVTRHKIKKDGTKFFEFGFNLSQNSMEEKNIYSSLNKEQQNLLKIIEIHYLEDKLKTKETCYNAKRKI